MYQISKNKVKSVDKENEYVIDFYRLTDRINTKQIRFPDFDRFIDRQIDTDFYRSTTPGKQTHYSGALAREARLRSTMGK